MVRSKTINSVILCALRASVVILLFFVSSCSRKQSADLIVHNAVIYTVDSTFSNAQSFAVKDGKFIAVGSNEEILSKFDAKEMIDAQGRSVYPGFIDSHCHFYGYGAGLQQVDLVGTKSFDEVLERVAAFSKEHPEANWIIGRGWDQNDWLIKEYPKRYELDKLFPDKPVLLERIDGHAALVNSVALELAKINAETKIKGGMILTDLITEKNGGETKWVSQDLAKETKHLNYPFPVPTGILVDNAVDLVKAVIPKPGKEEIKRSLLAAQKNCFAVGLTTVDDAGLEKNIIDAMDEFQKSGELKMRIYAMLTDNKENADYYMRNGPYKTDRLNVRSFKFYADGALGSRGACLIEPYSDKPEQRGFLLDSMGHYKYSSRYLSRKFQINTHCIGDSAVRMMLNIFQDTPMREARWRIEHFQVTTAEDIAKLKMLNSSQMRGQEIIMLIPSVQPTHATSDMYWVKDRLGPERVKYAYAYNDLLKAAGMLALGTDFPVENINPMYTFYAAVARKDLKGFPEGGFQMENALSRENTLRGMTIWGAYANFEEHEKGSIEKGKLADFVILDKDIMKCEIDSVPKAKVIHTFVSGELMY
jgi:predicted amidohydrolase YtcJ